MRAPLLLCTIFFAIALPRVYAQRVIDVFEKDFSFGYCWHQSLYPIIIGGFDSSAIPPHYNAFFSNNAHRKKARTELKALYGPSFEFNEFNKQGFLIQHIMYRASPGNNNRYDTSLRETYEYSADNLRIMKSTASIRNSLPVATIYIFNDKKLIDTIKHFYKKSETSTIFYTYDSPPYTYDSSSKIVAINIQGQNGIVTKKIRHMNYNLYIGVEKPHRIGWQQPGDDDKYGKYPDPYELIAKCNRNTRPLNTPYGVINKDPGTIASINDTPNVRYKYCNNCFTVEQLEYAGSLVPLISRTGDSIQSYCEHFEAYKWKKGRVTKYISTMQFISELPLSGTKLPLVYFYKKKRKYWKVLQVEPYPHYNIDSPNYKYFKRFH